MPKKEKKEKPAKGEAKGESAAEPAAASPWTCEECGQEHDGEEASADACVACEAPKPNAGAAEEEEDPYRGYKVGLVLGVEDLAGKLKAVSLDVGAGGDPLNVVTNAPNVAEGQRVVVATVGSVVRDKGEELTIKKTAVGGRQSEGMLCDSSMLGWAGGGSGTAAVVPPSFEPGARPPPSRPRLDK